MKESVHKKILLFGIIFLFFGAAILPSISGYDKKNIQSPIKVPSSFSSRGDYIDAYWKFDECSGNTLEDSSGHDYDGTIHGATWVSHGSGCALEFDGVNDYVDLDEHARYDLGFNKTDDLLFSFDFKTSSNIGGIIYSMCRGGAYAYNPGFHIAINSNGSIEVLAWRLGCGILMDTNGTYNDGDWHSAEIYYNGITEDPTVEIHVDNELDISQKKWVCAFYSDQFYHATIGKNSNNSTGYFDGTIDEFKIIKYPKGNEQVPPIIEGPTSGDIGVEYDYDFTTNDPEEDDIWLWIKWGDGDEDLWEGPYGSGETVTFSHKWDEEGEYYIEAQSKDIWHHSRFSDKYTVVIGNLPPEIPTFNGVKRYGNIGEELTFTVQSEDFEGNPIKYFINWDDGETEWTNFYPSGQEVTVKHTWDANGDYGITCYAEDNQGKKSTVSKPFSIRIGDQPPKKPIITGPQHGKPEEEYTFTFKSTDPEGDQVSFDIDWGDGSSITDYGPFDSGEATELSHTWTSRDTYTISARAIDSYGKTGDWEEFHIIIPRSKTLNLNMLEWLFVRFSNNYPIFKLLLSI